MRMPQAMVITSINDPATSLAWKPGRVIIQYTVISSQPPLVLCLPNLIGPFDLKMSCHR
jgi:hypothetical protein